LEPDQPQIAQQPNWFERTFAGHSSPEVNASSDAKPVAQNNLAAAAAPAPALQPKTVPAKAEVETVVDPEGRVVYQEKIEDVMKSGKMPRKSAERMSFYERFFGSDDEPEAAAAGDEKISYPSLAEVPAAPPSIMEVRSEQESRLRALQAEHERAASEKSLLLQEPSEQSVARPEAAVVAQPEISAKHQAPALKPAPAAASGQPFPPESYEPYQPPAKPLKQPAK
jgi:hypothetical protein